MQKNAALAEHATTKQETQYPGLHHARSSELAAVRYSGNADHSYRPGPTADPQFSKNDPEAVSTAAGHHRCAQCGTDPEVYTRTSDHGLMLHMVQEHGGQPLIQESVAQLRQLDRAACVLRLWHHSIATMQSPQSLQQGYSNRDITVGDVFQDRRQPGHQDAAASPTPHHPPHSPQPVPAFRRQSTYELLHEGHRHHRTRQAAARSSWSLSDGQSALQCLQLAISGHQSWAVLCRYRCRVLLA